MLKNFEKLENKDEITTKGSEEEAVFNPLPMNTITPTITTETAQNQVEEEQEDSFNPLPIDRITPHTTTETVQNQVEEEEEVFKESEIKNTWRNRAIAMVGLTVISAIARNSV